MRRIAEISLLMAYVATNTIPRWIEGIDSDIFCMWQAISYLCLCLAAIAKTDFSYLWAWALLLTFNNAYDEVLGNPHIVGRFKIGFAITVTIWATYKTLR